MLSFFSVFKLVISVMIIGGCFFINCHFKSLLACLFYMFYLICFAEFEMACLTYFQQISILKNSNLKRKRALSDVECGIFNIAVLTTIWIIVVAWCITALHWAVFVILFSFNFRNWFDSVNGMFITLKLNPSKNLELVQN